MEYHEAHHLPRKEDMHKDLGMIADITEVLALETSWVVLLVDKRNNAWRVRILVDERRRIDCLEKVHQDQRPARRLLLAIRAQAPTNRSQHHQVRALLQTRSLEQPLL